MTLAIPATLVIVTPVYNDWDSFARLAKAIDDVFARSPRCRVEILAVDDGSSDPGPDILPLPWASIDRVSIAHLVRNLGHQGAIAVGLGYLESKGGHTWVAVMDADGEDKPADLPTLLDALRADARRLVVFAERRRRTESWGFRFCHRLYLLLECLLVGRSLRVGNFSVLARAAVTAIVRSPEAWVHYAGTIKRLRLPFGVVPCDRGRRFSDRSKMSFTGLILHGLRGISVFREIVAIRLVLLFSAIFSLVIVLVPAVLYLKFFTGTSSPGWTTAVIGTASIMLIQVFAMLIHFVFVVLGADRGMADTPMERHVSLIREVKTVGGKQA